MKMLKKRIQSLFSSGIWKQTALRAGAIAVSFAVLISSLNLFGLNVYADTDVSADFLTYYDLNIQDGIVTGYTLKSIYNIVAVPSDLSLVIPSNVTGIGDNAFDRCNLTSVTIPSSVTSIGDYAFANCRFTSVTIPSSVTSIGSFAFEYCPLTSLTVPSSVTKSVAAFESCEDLTGVTLASGTTQIGDNEFDGCTSLKNVTIPDTVTSIGNLSFSSCPITSITIPSSVNTIGAGAFEDCAELKSIDLPGVTSIEGDAFSGCSGLTSVGFSSHLTYIGMQAFAVCQSLKSVSIPSSVTDVDYEAFDGSGLASITFESATTTIGEGQSGYKDNVGVTFPVSAVIYGYDPSTAKDYATEYGRTFKPIAEAPVTLESIAITTPPDKTSYVVGNPLDITGLVVTGTYNDGSTKAEPITAADISGFDSSNAVDNQTVTVTYGGKTAAFSVQIKPSLRLLIGKDTNSFSNSVSDFFNGYYSESNKFICTEYQLYDLSEPLLEKLSGNSHTLESKLRDYINSTPWNGSCYGISATMILSKLGSIDIDNFDKNAHGYYQMKLKDSGGTVNTQVRDLINYYHLAQQISSLNNDEVRPFANNPAKYSGCTSAEVQNMLSTIVSKAKDVNAGSAPFMLDLYWLQSDNTTHKLQQDGHTVVCNGLVTNPDGSVATDAEGDYELQIVDSIVTGKPQTLYIAHNCSSFKYNDGYNIDSSNWTTIGYMDTSKLSSIDIDGSGNTNPYLISGSGTATGINGTTNETEIYVENPSDFSLSSATGQLLSWSDEGSVTGTLSPDSISGITDDGGAGSSALIHLPQTGYYVVTPQQESMSVSALDNNSFASVDESGASNIVFKSNNAVNINGSSFSYTASVPDPTSEGNVQVSSNNGANVSISQNTQGVIVSSSNLQNLKVETIREPDGENTKQTVSTTKNSLLIRDKTGDSTGAVQVFVSSKNDGNYDQVIDGTSVSPVSTTYSLVYTAGTGGNVSGNASQAVSQGANGTVVTAVADSGYHFVKWSDGLTSATRQDKNVTGNIAVTALFSADSGNSSSQSNPNSNGENRGGISSPTSVGSTSGNSAGENNQGSISNPNTGDDKMNLSAMILAVILSSMAICVTAVSIRIKKKGKKQ